MTGDKWKFGTVNVSGQAVFGDNNRMNIDLSGLNVQNRDEVSAGLFRMNQAIQASSTQALKETLSGQQQDELQQLFRQVVDELKRPNQAQNHTFLRDCLSKITTIAAAIPSLVSTAVQLKGLLGL
jgi:hypothetical protein